MTEPKPPRKHRRGTENRARSHQVAVRLNPAENALLQAVVASSGKSAPSVLRDAFLATTRPRITLLTGVIGGTMLDPGCRMGDYDQHDCPGGRGCECGCHRDLIISKEGEPDA